MDNYLYNCIINSTCPIISIYPDTAALDVGFCTAISKIIVPEIKIYPNPFSNDFTIELSEMYQGAVIEKFEISRNLVI